MSSLTPAQRRVLEAAQRGDLTCVGGYLNKKIRERSEDGATNRVVSGIGFNLIALELLRIDDWDSEESPVRPTALGRAELGITETEEG